MWPTPYCIHAMKEYTFEARHELRCLKTINFQVCTLKTIEKLISLFISFNITHKVATFQKGTYDRYQKAKHIY